MPFSIEKYHFKTGSLLKGLPFEEFRLLKKNMIRKELKKNEIIFREGSFPRGVYILRKGKVKIFQTNRDGKEQIVYIYKKGEVFGYRPLICNSVHPVSATTIENSVVSFIPQKYFTQALNSSSELSNRLLINLSHEFSVWVNKISMFAQQPVRERIALALLILNEKYKKEKKTDLPSVINLSREDLANYIGTVPETLVRLLKEFKKRKIIRTEGRKIIVLNPRELKSIADFY